MTTPIKIPPKSSAIVAPEIQMQSLHSVTIGYVVNPNDPKDEQSLRVLTTVSRVKEEEESSPEMQSLHLSDDEFCAQVLAIIDTLSWCYSVPLQVFARDDVDSVVELWGDEIDLRDKTLKLSDEYERTYIAEVEGDDNLTIITGRNAIVALDDLVLQQQRAWNYSDEEARQCCQLRKEVYCLL